MRHPLLLLLAACASSPKHDQPQPDPLAAKEVAARICTLFIKGKVPCEHDGPVAITDEHRIGVHTSSVQSQIGRQHLLDLSYHFSIDDVDQPALRSQIKGDGLSHAEAVKKAASDWAAVYGTALTDRLVDNGFGTILQAVVDNQKPQPVATYRSWRAYSGYLSIAGRSKRAEPIVLANLLTSLAPSLDPAVAYQSLYLEISVSQSGKTTGHCLLNGAPSAPLCEKAIAYPWPEPNPHYLLKQSVVFAPLKAKTTINE